jgi:hypothetical protein
MDLLEIVWGGVDWIGLAQDRDKCRALVNSVTNLRVPQLEWASRGERDGRDTLHEWMVRGMHVGYY